MIPEELYKTHRAQNYAMAQKTKYKRKLYLEQANRQREIISKNWYDIRKGEKNDNSDQGTDEELSGRGQD